MKKNQFASSLLFTGLAFIVFTSFKNDNHVSVTKNPIGRETTLHAVKHISSGAVTITAVFNFSTFPDVFGTFTTSGALNISGDAEMVVGPNENGKRAHCVVTLTASDGTITIHQECQFASDPAKGRWEIVSGTGAYANLQGNGSLTMPPNTEAMEGVIY
jgi:hypothetical protein